MGDWPHRRDHVSDRRPGRPEVILAQEDIDPARVGERPSAPGAANPELHDDATAEPDAYFAALRFEPGDRSPLMVLGISLFLRYVFTNWEFEKLYMEVPEYNPSSSLPAGSIASSRSRGG